VIGVAILSSCGFENGGGNFSVCQGNGGSIPSGFVLPKFLFYFKLRKLSNWF